MLRPPPRSTLTDTLFPYTTLFRSDDAGAATQVEAQAVVAEVLLAHDAGAEARQLQRRAALRTGEVFTFAVAAVEAFDRPVRAEVIAAANAVAAVVVAGRLAVELELGVGVAGFDPAESGIGAVGPGRHRTQWGRKRGGEGKR